MSTPARMCGASGPMPPFSPRRLAGRLKQSPKFARRLTGRKIESLGRRAKYLLADLDDGNVLVMHLGMSGSFRIEGKGRTDTKPVADDAVYYKRGKLQAHDHVVFHMQGGVDVIYNDPRRFGFMLLILAMVYTGIGQWISATSYNAARAIFSVL